MFTVRLDGRTALVLGPGFAPGLAGLGLLWELERRGIEVGLVAGANTGAVAAALWALRRDLELAARVLASLPWERFITSGESGPSDPLLAALSLLTGRASFADLDRRLIVIARELDTGAPRLVQEGTVAAALRVSMAVPGLFEPPLFEGEALIDGGGALPAAAAELRERFAGELDDVIEVYVVPPREATPRAPGVPERALRLARYASTTWPTDRDRSGVLWIGEAPAGLLDFEAVTEWFQAGVSAAQRLLDGTKANAP